MDMVSAVIESRTLRQGSLMRSDTSGTGVSLRDPRDVRYPGQKNDGNGKGPRGSARGPCGTCGVGAPASHAADLSREGLDSMQGTRTLRQAHTKAPAVAAMAHASLRLGAPFVFPRQSGCGYTSAPEGGEMS